MSLVVLAGCAAPPPSPCLLPGEKPMLVAELFFGRDIPGRAPLSDAEWAGFAGRIIALNFPAGFTVIDGEGQWRDPQTGRIVREPSKILTVAATPTADTARRLAAVIDAYEARFHQQSVGILTHATCGTF